MRCKDQHEFTATAVVDADPSGGAAKVMFEYNVGNWKTPEAIAHGLTATGRPIRGPNAEGLYETTTVICHNGDSHQRDGSLKLWFRPDGKGGTQAGCNSAGCGEGRDGQRELLDKLRAAAGVERPRRGTAPTIYGDNLTAVAALYSGAFTSSEDGLTRATCPAWSPTRHPDNTNL